MKFECPACGQHLECDRAFGGDVIHCPRCCAEIRVPFGADQQVDGSVSRAELISQPAVATSASPQPAKATSEPARPPASTPPQPTEVKCPVCEAELRIRAGLAANAGDRLPIAELIRKGPGRKGDADHSKSAKPAPTGSHHLSIEEREQQIATARKEHPVQLYSPMKPRLDYVLSGEAPPPANEESTPKPPQQPDPEPEPNHPQSKSFNE